MMRTESTKSFESDYSNDADDVDFDNDVEVSSLDDDDELPF